MSKRSLIFCVGLFLTILFFVFAIAINSEFMPAALASFVITGLIAYFFSDTALNNKIWKEKGYAKILEENFVNVEDMSNIEALNLDAGLTEEGWQISKIEGVKKGEPWQNVSMFFSGIIYELISNPKKIKKELFVYVELPKTVDGTIVILDAYHYKKMKDNLVEMKVANVDFNNRYRVYADNLQLFNSIINEKFIKDFYEVTLRTYSGAVIIKNNRLYIQIEDYKHRPVVDGDPYKAASLEYEYFQEKTMFIFDTVEMIKDAIINL